MKRYYFIASYRYGGGIKTEEGSVFSTSYQAAEKKLSHRFGADSIVAVFLDLDWPKHYFNQKITII